MTGPPRCPLKKVFRWMTGRAEMTDASVSPGMFNPAVATTGLICISITDKQSFKDIENWLSEVDKFANENVVRLLVGNKCDME